MIVDLALAKTHLRIDGTAEDALLTVMIGASERIAVEFISRSVYANDEALAAAVAAAPAALTVATASYETSLAAAGAIVNCVERDMAVFACKRLYEDARQAARMAYEGIVVNDAIKSAVLLILGHLYLNRETVYTGAGTAVEMPMGARSFLWPFRVGLGI